MSSSQEDVETLLSEMDFDSKALTKQIAEICWFMRGSINWDQAWRLTGSQREVVVNLINKNIENTEKSKMPLL